MFDKMINECLKSGNISKESQPYLLTTYEYVRKNIDSKDWKYLLPIILAVYIIQQNKINYSPKIFFDAVVSATTPLLPAFHVLPPNPYGILNFDPLSNLMEYLVKNIVDILNINVDVMPF
jgi:hypothetical protein